MAEATPDHADVAVVSETPLSVNKLAAFHANPSVFKSIRYPSSDAVRITQDALRAASQYYELFFQTPTEGPAPSQDGTAVAAPSPAPTKARERGAVRKTSKAEASMRTSACPIATTKGRATATAMGAPVIRDDHRVPASTATVVLDSTNTGDEQTDALSRIISVSPFPAPAPHSSPFELCVHTLETTPAHHFYPSCISPIQRST